MSLPPERLRVKRKRDDDPVDALYVQTSQHSSKRRVTVTPAQQYVFRRLKEEKRAVLPQEAGIPRIIPTKPGEEIDFFDKQRGNAAGDALDHGQQHDGKAQKLPRRYHLSKDMRMPTTSPVTGKRQRAVEHNIAVLVEDRRKENSLFDSSNDSNILGTGLEQEGPPRKRPSAATRVRSRLGNRHDEGRDKIHGQTSKDGDQTRELQLQDAMQKFATEYGDLEANNRPQYVGIDSGAAKEDVAMTDDDDYVYDTYVRYQVMMEPSDADDTMATTPGNIGYIMLEEGDEEWWEKYADEMDSDDDWNSEQDDENAENYYGADYPDEDLASDDEHGFDPYRFRHGGASDEEEFGSDWDEWSNNGVHDHQPWKSNAVKSTALRKDGGVESE